MGNGLVEGLQVFEFGLELVLRCRAEVLKEPPVGGAPGLLVLLAKRLRKILAQQRVGIQREQRAGLVPVHREQLCVLQPGEGEVAMRLAHPDERLG